jgi:Flp pilus assembly protein TadB
MNGVLMLTGRIFVIETLEQFFEGAVREIWAFALAVPPWLIGGIAAIWLGLVLSRVFARPLWTRKQRKIIDRYFEPAREEESPAASVHADGSLEWRLKAAGYDLGDRAAVKLRGMQASILVVALLILAGLKLPMMLDLSLAAVAAYVPEFLVNLKVESRARSIDREIPEAYGRMAAMMSTQPGVAELFHMAAEQLRTVNPLSALAEELERTSKDIRMLGAEKALEELEARAPTATLADLAFTMKLYVTAGGQFSDAIVSAADRARIVEEARATANSKAAQAWILVLAIPLLLVGVLLVSMRDPTFRRAYYAPAGQILLAATVVLMAVGFVFIKGMVDEVTK